MFTSGVLVALLSVERLLCVWKPHKVGMTVCYTSPHCMMMMMMAMMMMMMMMMMVIIMTMTMADDDNDDDK
jgi:hypothetical protein